MPQPVLKRSVGYLLVGVIAALLAPVGATAADMIPADLVLELLKVRPHYGEEPTLLVGSAPEEMSEVLPEDIEVLVSLSSERGASIIGRSSLSRSQLLGRLESGFGEHGWSRFRREASGGGFQPSTEGSGIVLCHDDGGTVSVEVESKGEEETSLRLRYSVGSGYSSCRRMSRQARHMEGIFGGEVPFPTLYPPEGAKSSGGGGGSGGEFERSASTLLETDATPGDLLDDYAAQLGQQGWLPDTVVLYDALAHQSWLFLDDVGNQWHGLLMVKTNPRDSSKHEVDLQVRLLGGN